MRRLGVTRRRPNSASRADVEAVAASGLFDRDWYLEQNPDVRAAGIDPLRHYLRYGAGEGRDPNPLFDSDWYLEQNPEVGATGVNPLVHYLRCGAAEGRAPGPDFAGSWYVDRGLGLLKGRDRTDNDAGFAGTSAARSLKQRAMRAISRAAAGRNIAIFDNAFPHTLSPFRFEEFVSYLDALPKARVYTDGRVLPNFGEPRSLQQVIDDHSRNYPHHLGRVLPLANSALPDGAVAYTVFADNIHYYLEAIERHRMPFAFTLYPGAGFRLGQADVNERLKRVFGSPWFRRVIATQPITRDYLLANEFCPEERIAYIEGGVTVRSVFDAPDAKPRFGFAKRGIDICFVAYRHNPAVLTDKGYDLFVEAAKQLCAAGVDARFHVVGNFDATLADLGSAAPHFRFYGIRKREFFRDFYRHMDLILAPTRPFALRAGAFDGFPTAACVEAGLQEVAIVCSDELHLNRSLDNGSDIVLVRPVLEDVVNQVMQLIGDPQRLANLGTRGRKGLIKVFNREAQMKPRLEMLRSLANE